MLRKNYSYTEGRGLLADDQVYGVEQFNDRGQHSQHP